MMCCIKCESIQVLIERAYSEHYGTLKKHAAAFVVKYPHVNQEDLIQDAMAVVWKKRHELKFKTINHLVAYVKNQMFWRATTLARKHLPINDIDVSRVLIKEHAREQTDESDLLLYLNQILHGSTNREKELAFLKYGLGYTTKDIAEIFGVSTSTLNVYLFRLRRQIKTQIIQKENPNELEVKRLATKYHCSNP